MVDLHLWQVLSLVKSQELVMEKLKFNCFRSTAPKVYRRFLSQRVTNEDILHATPRVSVFQSESHAMQKHHPLFPHILPYLASLHLINYKLIVTVILLLCTINTGGHPLHSTSKSPRYPALASTLLLVPSTGLGNVVNITAVCSLLLRIN